MKFIQFVYDYLIPNRFKHSSAWANRARWVERFEKPRSTEMESATDKELIIQSIMRYEGARGFELEQYCAVLSGGSIYFFQQHTTRCSVT